VNHVRSMTMLALGGLTFGLLVANNPSLSAQERRLVGPEAADPIRYEAIPGVREFSGQMIARPRQIADLTASGLPVEQAKRRHAEASDLLENYRLREYVPQTDKYVFHVPENRTENEVANELMSTGLFEYVEPDWTVYPVECPNDPRLGSQWHHNADRMQSCDGWDIHTGDPSVGVGLCDTGVNVNHEDLLLHRREGYNAVDRVWENDGGNINDINGHGTWVTGCAAGNGDNGVGIAGVGWNLSHRMMRVSNSPGGGSNLSTLQHGARTSIENGDRVASVSSSGVDSNSNLTTATYIKSQGGLLVWAAGNENRNLTISDRDADDIIVAAATDQNDNKASFSNFGRFVDVAAPGVSVFTTDRSGGYAAVSGTSFSCPLTAGLCALIWSFNPSLTPDEVEAVLKAGADDLGNSGIDDIFGHGRINVFGALTNASRPVAFEFPNGRPDMINPDGGDSILVNIIPEDETPDTDSAMFHYNDGGGFVDVPMPFLGNNQYEATFGPTTCGEDVAYYFSIETLEGNLITNPGGAPDTTYHTLSANGIDTLLVENFEQDNGWTVENIDLEDGPWERAIPAGGGDRGDPPTDSDGSGRCFVTDNFDGNSDIDGGPTRLTSPRFDLTGTKPIISYDRWFFNDDRDQDRFTVEVSNDDGNNWSLVDEFGDSGEAWVSASFRLEEFVTPTSQVRVRFSATDNPNDSVTEAGLDNFRIEEIDCGGGSQDCLTLSIENLVGGEEATVTVLDGTPGVRAVTVYGLESGVTLIEEQFDYCATFGIEGVTRNRVVGGLNQSFDNNGEMSFDVPIPSGAGGTRIFFQSAMQGTCPDECVSNLVDQVIQ